MSEREKPSIDQWPRVTQLCQVKGYRMTRDWRWAERNNWAGSALGSDKDAKPGRRIWALLDSDGIFFATIWEDEL